MALGRRNSSRATVAVLAAFLEDGDAELYGLEVCQLARLPSGSLYPILARLEQANVLSSRWEKDEEAARHPGRRRRYYRLTPTGLAYAAAEVRSARAELGWQVVPGLGGAT